MILWLDAHLSPALAPWIQSTFNVETLALRDIGLRDATDEAIFRAARAAKVIEVVQASGAIMGKVESIQRVGTVGGATPSDAANATHLGDEKRVEYCATYKFYGAASQPALKP